MLKNSLVGAVLLLAAIYWIVLVPGPKGANDYPYNYSQVSNYQISQPFIWDDNTSEGLGEYKGALLWSWPMNQAYALVESTLKLPPAFSQRLLGFIPIFILGVWSIKRWLKKLGLSEPTQIIGSLFYLVNSYIILLIDGGQLSIALAYSFIPVVVYQIEEALSGDYRKKLIAGLCVSILGFFDIRYLYLLLILEGIFFLFNVKESKKNIKNYLSAGLMVGLVFVGLNFYWLLPIFLINRQLLPVTYDRLAQVSSLSFVSLGHAILLQQPHWYKNIFGQVSRMSWLFLPIPVLGFLATQTNKKNRVVAVWLVILIIGIFLSKGDQEPLANIYKFIFVNVPGFKLFRDSSKFFVLVTLAYTVLIAFCLERIQTKFKGNTKLWLAAILYLIIISWPIWTNKMTGMLSFPLYEREYLSLAHLLDQDQAFSRSLWIPSQAASTYQNAIHPSLESNRLIGLRPFAIGVKGEYETSNYLREASFSGQLLDVIGVKYLSYPYLDPRRDDISHDHLIYYYSFLDQLMKKSWVKLRTDSSLPVLETTQHQDRIFATANTWWVVGSDNLYNQAPTNPKLALSKNALIFSEQSPGLGNQLQKLPKIKIVLNNKSSLDLAASFIEPKLFVFPSQNLDFSPNRSGWWKRESADLINWRNFLQTKYGVDNQDFDYGGGWAVSEGEHELTVSSSNFGPGKKLLIRVMESSVSGKLQIAQGGSIISDLNTKITTSPNVVWRQAGNLVNNRPIVITSQGAINVINSIVAINQEVLEDYQLKAQTLLSQAQSDYQETNVISDDRPQVSYQRLNPTLYSVQISGLKRPSTLVLSEKYDPGWQILGQSGYPVYSLLNGFYIDKDGEYRIEYQPQKYLSFGFIVSLICLFVILALLILKKTIAKILNLS